MRKSIIAAFLLSALLLTGCAGKEQFSLSVRNITGVPISELELAPEHDNEHMINRLSENLENDSEILLDLGKYSAEDIADGFQLIAVNAEDGTASDLFSRIMLQSGDTLTLYWDDLGLAIAVNTSDDEIRKMIDDLHADKTETN